MSFQEKITGTILKQWFINAYIDLEKNKPLIQELVSSQIELNDIENLNYCMKNIVEKIEDLPENSDCTWVLEIATEIASFTANSQSSILLYQYLSYALKEAKTYLTPVDVITLIANISKLAGQENINITTPCVGDIFINAKEQCEYLQSPLDIESTCQCLITASQIVLVESTHEYKKIDYKIAMACIILSALEYAWKEKEFTSNVVSNMLKDLKDTIQKETLKTNHKKQDFELIYSIETTLENMEKIRKNIQNIGAQAIVAGQSDPFGIGKWTVIAETMTPLSILPIKTNFMRLNLHTTNPVKLQTYSNIRQENNVISIFERMTPKTTTHNEINVIASVQNLSFLEPIVRTNAQVIYKLDEIQLLQNIIGSCQSDYIILMPSNDKDKLIMKNEKEINEKRDQIIIANTNNDLEIKYLCEKIATEQEILKEHSNVEKIQEYLQELLNEQHTITLKNEYENIDETINDFITDNDTHISVLLDSKEAVLLQQRIEQIIYSKNPNIDLEIILGTLEEIILLAR